jgi:hypothetical protein
MQLLVFSVRRWPGFEGEGLHFEPDITPVYHPGVTDLELVSRDKVCELIIEQKGL